jgi:hypothetical protein
LIAHFDIFCQQEVNWIYNCGNIHVEGVPEKKQNFGHWQYIAKTSSQCNLPAQIEQLQDTI